MPHGTLRAFAVGNVASPSAVATTKIAMVGLIAPLTTRSCLDPGYGYGHTLGDTGLTAGKATSQTCPLNEPLVEAEASQEDVKEVENRDQD